MFAMKSGIKVIFLTSTSCDGNFTILKTFVFNCYCCRLARQSPFSKTTEINVFDRSVGRARSN